MKLRSNVYMLEDSESAASIAVFKALISWCRGTLLQSDETRVSILVTDDLGMIERDRHTYSVAVFVCDKDNVGSSSTITSTIATLEHNVSRALARFEKDEAINKA
jgi:hypothetical protein